MSGWFWCVSLVNIYLSVGMSVPKEGKERNKGFILIR